MTRSFWPRLGLLLGFALSSSEAARAEFCVASSNPVVTVNNLMQNLACVNPMPPAAATCTCSALPARRCQKATFGDLSYLVLGTGPTFTIFAKIPVLMPDNRLNNLSDVFGGWPDFEFWNAAAPTPNCYPNCSSRPGWINSCGVLGGTITFDKAEVVLNVSASCSSIPALPNGGKYSFSVYRCPGPGCQTEVASPTIDFSPGNLRALLRCPPTDTCQRSESGSSGAAGASCSLCQPVGEGSGGGAGCSVGVGGGEVSCTPAGGGPGALLRYRSGGVGGADLAGDYPGAVAWRTELGRYWSHDYAQRIVLDPNVSHVWLLTRDAVFIEFGGLPAGTGVRQYATTAPADEFRKLFYTGSGWELRTLDGRIDLFDAGGRWQSTVFASDPSHPIQSTYTSGKLTSVSFPDGRSETFTYHPGGKLASITAVPVAGSGTPLRVWSYVWSGDTLTEIQRPDGTRWSMTYDPVQIGYLSRVERIGTDNSARVEAAFEYSGPNVIRSWRGDPSFSGLAAVDQATYTYTLLDTRVPSETQVSRAVSPTFTEQRTIVLGRDTLSPKPKVVSVKGICPSCGLTPSTTFTYNGANPMLPSAIFDAKGTRTDFTYNANGRMLTRVEAANVSALTRLTSYTYDAIFPGLTARIERPSTEGGGNLRSTAFTWHPTTGLMTAQTIDGFEGGAPLPSTYKTTSYTHNSSGEVLSIEPPGFGSVDQTTFTYDLTNRNGHIADTRTDPVVGTTLFGYDGFNRRTSVTDPNGVRTTTMFDPLDRVIEVRQEGAVVAEDLVTTHTYNVFGDPFCTRLPRGNGIESRYDAAGRLLEVRRGTAVTTPSGTTCLEATEPLERTLYAYDLAGHRTEERRQSWNGTSWIESGFTGYTYTCHLDKTTQGSGAATSVTEYCYDLNDNLEQIWDAKHPRASFPTPSTSYSYDALNRMTTASQPWGGAGGGTAITQYAYDVQDHLRLVIDANNNMTTYETGDRDLMTEESSPVFSGATNFTRYSYDEHGNLAQKTDPRGITTLMTHDPADRMTQTNPPGSDLDTDFFYDAPSVDFSKGRLTSIVRPGSTIAYEYDRFGRVTKDGALGYGYDPNGNRTAIAYSPSVALCYGFDALDRPIALKQTTSGGDPCATGSPLVTSASYLPSGPVTNLALGNGLTETRAFDARYFPVRIEVPGALTWDYTVDAVGNPTGIAKPLPLPVENRAFGYQDYQYFLTSATGPWAGLGWTYDRIGNRLSEFQVGQSPPFTYSYQQNGLGGNTPKLTQIQPRPQGSGGGSITQTYDLAGNQITHLSAGQEGSGQTATLTYSAESKLSALNETPGVAATTLLYDGRGFLRDALLTYRRSEAFEHTEPIYSSAGQLMSRRRRSQSTFGTPQDDGSIGMISEDQTAYVFYFAGRPVAQLTTGASGPGSGLVYLTADHLGTPVLATDSTGATIWSGGFTPFGEPYQLMPPTLFLRLPGQWTDATWEGLGGGGLYYNVHRWYGAGVGRYTAPDPLGPLSLGTSTYAYAQVRPVRARDPLGLYVVESSAEFEDSAGSAGFTSANGWRADFQCYCCGSGWCSEFRIKMPFLVRLPKGGRRSCVREHELVHVLIAEQWFFKAADPVLLPLERKRFPTEQSCAEDSARALERLARTLKDQEWRLGLKQQIFDVVDFLNCLW